MSGHSHHAPLLFPELGKNAPLFKARQILDEHFTFEMIHFMLDAHCEQAVRCKLERFALGAERAHCDAFGARHFFENAGHR